MSVRRFLAWSRMVPPGQRAEGVRALASGYLYSAMAPDMRAEAEAALTGLLDDPSPQVRLALAEAFASAVEAPHHCVIALAYDQPEIACVVLGRSPLLGDDDLIDCASRGEAAVQCAIASRPSLSAAVSMALADSGGVEALIALAQNPGADVPEFGLRRMVERFGDDGALREALLTRPHLPPCIRSDLIHAAATGLANLVIEAGWLSGDRAGRLQRDVTERAMIDIVIEAAQEDSQTPCLELARHLRLAGRLTPSLMLRALLCGDRRLFEAALAELSGLPLGRTRGFVRDHQGGGFAALYARARMPADLLPIFKTTLAAQDRVGPLRPEDMRLSRPLIDSVLRACGDLEGAGAARVSAMLRRLDAEAAQQDARALTERLAEELQTPYPPLLTGDERHAPLLALTSGP